MNTRQRKSMDRPINNEGEYAEIKTPSTAAPHFEVFPVSNFRGVVGYHLFYHFNVHLHINHLIFGNLYLISLLMFGYSLGGLIGMGVTSLIYLSLCNYVMGWKVKYGIVFTLHFAILFFIGWKSSMFYESSAKDARFPLMWFSLCSILFCFICQLIGHQLFESRQAKPSLYHGFIAAPPLELLSLIMRVSDERSLPTELRGIWSEVVETRRATL
jgi:uncharacterized membrane protein YGL010W